MELCRACLDPKCTALTHGGKTPRGYPQYLSLPTVKR